MCSTIQPDCVIAIALAFAHDRSRIGDEVGLGRSGVPGRVVTGERSGRTNRDDGAQRAKNEPNLSCEHEHSPPRWL